MVYLLGASSHLWSLTIRSLRIIQLWQAGGVYVDPDQLYSGLWIRGMSQYWALGIVGLVAMKISHLEQQNTDTLIWNDLNIWWTENPSFFLLQMLRKWFGRTLRWGCPKMFFSSSKRENVCGTHRHPSCGSAMGFHFGTTMGFLNLNIPFPVPRSLQVWTVYPSILPLTLSYFQSSLNYQ